ncbi:TonB-dependent receptor [Candidatus Halobeggiatoa sp. HSG11]|nr:TonB-dependent receptor [Candidatus Halobeggiatoa sp. HSG11]
MLRKLLFLIYFSIFNVNAEEVTKLLSKLSLGELMNVEIVVASKTSQKISDAPSSVTVFTRKELLEMGITSVEELMNFVPGFQATREIVFSHGYMATGRGQSTAQASFNILFLIDGQRISNDISGGALTVNYLITLANVEQVEIIRGPGSALYGTSAFTGVVNIITAKNINNAFIGKGSLNSEEFYINMSQQGDNWKASIFARHFEDEGQFYENIENELINSFNTQDPKDGNDVYLSYTWNDKLKVNFRHTKRQLQGFLYRESIKDSEITNGFESTQNFINAKYNLLDTQKHKLNLYGSYLTMEELRYNALQDTSLILSDLEESEWQLGLDEHYNFNANHKLLAGLVLRKPNIGKARENLTGIEEIYITEIGRDIIGIYLQDQYSFNNELEITIGIRNDYYSDFGNTTNPRAALVYIANPKTKFKLMYGQAFRAPSFRQTSTVNFLGNPYLKPETVKTTEFAWLQEYSYAKTTLTLFHSRFENKIDTVITADNKRFFENTDGVNTTGLELEASAKINNLNLRGTYTYFFDTEEKPRRVAKQTLSLIANYEYGLWNFNLNGYYHSDIEQDIKDSIITHDDYWLWNNTIRYRLNKNLTLVSRINNLLDEEYYNSTKNLLFTKGIPNRGRTFLLGAEIEF